MQNPYKTARVGSCYLKAVENSETTCFKYECHVGKFTRVPGRGDSLDWVAAVGLQLQ
jgi:hypothetical protein